MVLITAVMQKQGLSVILFICVYIFLFQFLGLASSILNFITTSMLKSRNNFIRNYLSVSLTEQHMATLASIIKDVDKDVKGKSVSLYVHMDLKVTGHAFEFLHKSGHSCVCVLVLCSAFLQVPLMKNLPLLCTILTTLW